MDDFAHGAIAAVRDRFSADLKDSVSESDLKGAREELAGVAGGFQTQISQTTRTVQGAPIYVSKSQFEHYKVELKLMFDDTNQIIYFRIAPISDVSPETMEASAKDHHGPLAAAAVQRSEHQIQRSDEGGDARRPPGSVLDARHDASRPVQEHSGGAEGS